ATGDREQESRAGRPAQSVDDKGTQFGAILDVSSDNQIQPIGQRDAPQPRRAQLPVADELDLVRSQVRYLYRPGRQVAGERLQPWISEQINCLPVGSFRNAFVDRLDGATKSEVVELICDLPGISGYDSIDLPVDITGRVPPQRTEQKQRGGGKQRRIAQCQ